MYPEKIDCGCPKCGGDLEEDYFHDEYECVDCKARFDIQDICDDLPGADGMEECCISCGCSAYPDCKNACSIFDD